MHSLLRFGPFELDVDNAELRRAGEIVKLPPQPFTALTLLVARRGGLVTRDEFRSAIWGDDSFVDFSAGLNFCIAQVRAALDDPASRSAYIVSIPRRGYKFVAPVEEERPRSCPTPTGSPDARAGAAVAARESMPVWLVLVASAAAIAAAIAWTRPDPTPIEAPKTPEQRQLLAAEQYARGALALADSGPEELTVRVRYFENAVDEDPGFAPAYAALADAKLVIGNYRVEAPQAAYAAAKSAAARALEIAPGLAEAHTTFGAAALYLEWDWKAAGEHLARGVALNPSSARAHQWYSRYLSARGLHDRAVEHARLAVQLAPGSASALTDLGMAAFYAHRFQDAMRICDDAAEMLPAFVPARRCAADAAAEAGDVERTTRYRARLDPARADAIRAVAQRDKMAGFWRDRVTQIESAMQSGDCDGRAVSLAVALAHAGEGAPALEWLERAANRRADALVFAAVHPAFGPLHDNRRFTRLLQRVGLAPLSAF
jgi:DNA-binding winged helix-turn-helix (wHTH) protein/Tfp pilus assembly protein PilF